LVNAKQIALAEIGTAKQEVGVPDQVVENRNLIEVVRANGAFRKNYGRWLGAFLYVLSMRESRPPV
jgi:hypothetical protein